MDPHKRIKIALTLVFFFLGLGTAGYSMIAGYSALDAFYMTVITISTVGYGEIQQLTGAGRLFTIFLILSGVSSIAFLAGAFTELVIERAANPNRLKKVMQKKIERLENHIIICGHGRVGAAAAEYFSKRSIPFVVIENAKEELKRLEEFGYLYIEGDGTREEVLKSAAIKRASSLLAVLNSDPDNLFAVLTARELNPVLHIIARIEYPSSESRMLRAGADSVISPFVAAGQSVAESLLAKSSALNSRDEEEDEEEYRLQQKPKWVNATEESLLPGRSVTEGELLVNCEIVGIRRQQKDILLPPKDAVILTGDALLILPGHIEATPLLAVQPKKLVFIDDNPAILRLYTRLFQKSGFNVICASTGLEGYELTRKESPDAVIIDTHLPDMAGIVISRKIRELPFGQKVKIFLFSKGDREELEEQAMEAGVDKVVVKSPEAGEIVALVLENLA